jgi:CubicO group peptidase (beta-lactamase class C family)
MQHKNNAESYAMFTPPISRAFKSSISLIIATLMLLMPLSGIASLEMSKPEKQGVSSEKLERLSELSKQYVDEGRVTGIVNLVLRNGEVIHYEATGNRGSDDPSPMQVDDLFRIYSMTKPITAVAAMQLYEQGKFQLSDPVTKFVPELKELKVLNAAGQFEPAAREMTMHQLLMHTTGMSYGFAAATDAVDQRYAMADLWAAKDLDELAVRIGQLPLKFHPGDRWHYSVAVDITGIVVQRLSGQPFDEYLEEHIFEPLGMSDTFFEVPESERERFVPNHFINPETGALTNTKYAPPPFSYRDGVAMIDYFDVSLFSGGGGLVSTAMDYAKFSEMMRRGGSFNGARILGPKTVAFMTKNHLAENSMLDSWGEKPTDDIGRPGFGFGLGFGVVTDSTAISIMGSDGEYNWGGAAGTVFWIDPVEELVVISMIQLMQSPWPLRSDVKVAVYQALSETYEK